LESAVMAQLLSVASQTGCDQEASGWFKAAGNLRTLYRQSIRCALTWRGRQPALFVPTVNSIRHLVTDGL
jgi:hypothetical protein